MAAATTKNTEVVMKGKKSANHQGADTKCPYTTSSSATYFTLHKYPAVIHWYLQVIHYRQRQRESCVYAYIMEDGHVRFHMPDR